MAQARECVSGYDWKSVYKAGGPKAYINAVTGAVDFLRDVTSSLNAAELGGEHVGGAVPQHLKSSRSSVGARVWTRQPGRCAL
ncbi:hypothetical protein [Paramicrobacterium chengjingii]|uniref:hypothetical protein n=1 Tax=Paramicrobacterium chengjingii TaxID=2769067 RepID=UPI001F233C18|nr:hypothetical protein [Microbacterium chengjingii]